MCEKPISVDVEATAQILEKANSRPDQKFLVPFCRRCESPLQVARVQDLGSDRSPDDDSYRNVKNMVEAGSLGHVHAVETTCLDQQDPTGTSDSQESTPPVGTFAVLTMNLE